MGVTLNAKRSKRKSRHIVNIHQNQFPLAYISTIDNSRRDQKSLSDMTNMEIVQDNIPRPRPPLLRYGTQAPYPIIGRGKIKHSGERSLLWMLNVSGVGKLYRQTDGEAFSLVGGTYDDEAWASCVQSKGRGYVFNSVNNLSYVTLDDNVIHTYTSLATPAISAVTASASLITGTRSYTHYYRVTANNDVGESIGSAAMSTTANKVREAWVTTGPDNIAITWAAITGAVSYTVYYGTDANTLLELYTVTATTFTDDGTLATNPFKVTPEGNSTQGAVFTWMYVDTKNSQIYGITADNKLFYSAAGTGDFSPYNGGGYVGIDVDGDGQLNFVDGFRNGKGDAVITVSSRGAAGKGKLYHVEFASLTVGDQTIVYPNVYEANGQASTYAPRATIKARDSLWYPTGSTFNSTGTSQNILNILTTMTVAQGIQPDVDRINIKALNGACAVEHEDKIFYALPVGSDTNSEIWYIDLARKNLWVLRWPIAATDLWLYEDSDGAVHFCALVGGIIMEFTRAGSQTHQDDGVAWRSRCAFQSLVWDEDGITLAKIQNQYFKFLFPKGNIRVNAIGLSRKGVQSTAGSDAFTVTTTFTGYDVWTYDNYEYDADPGSIETFGKSVAVLRIKPKGLLAQLDWEVIGETAGTDYFLSAVNTKGFSLDDLILKI
jgi:hypothetical protein